MKKQAPSRRWYTEQVCHLTASNFGVIAKRREANMLSLDDQLIYKSPPVTKSIKFGKDNERVAVELYQSRMAGNGKLLVLKKKTGLHVHPTNGFLAASPDGIVTDKPSSAPIDLLEVKCMPSIDGQVEEQVGKKSLCLVKESSGYIHLSKDHAFYYKVQGQLACTGYMWCDFVIMTHSGHIYIERITSDASFWAHLVHRLSRFYKQFYVRGLVYPHFRPDSSASTGGISLPGNPVNALICPSTFSEVSCT